MAIIAIHGPRQSGKSTLSRLIENRVHCNRLSFADPIRVSVLRICAGQLRGGVDLREEHWKNKIVRVHRVAFVGQMFPGGARLRNMPDILDASSLVETKDKHMWTLTVRNLMRLLGDAFKQEFNNPAWFAKHLLLRHREDDHGITIIDDLRFPAELEALEYYSSAEGEALVCVKITGRGDSTVEHSSDAVLPDARFDLVVDNSEDDVDQLALLLAARKAVSMMK